MKAVTYSAPGLIENLGVGLVKVPLVRDNECLIKVYYSAINRADTLQRKGMYPVPPGESEILGLEAVGIVHQECPNSKFKKNDRVMALLSGGGNAEYVSAKAENMIHIPDWMSLRNAGAIPEVWLTAFQLIYHISIVTKK